MDNLLLKDNVVKFIKFVLIKLTCCNRIDHRDHDRTSRRRVSRLEQLIKMHNSVDTGIEVCATEYLSSNDFKQHYDDISNDENKQDEDFMEDLKSDLLNELVFFAGLYELHNLHGEEYNKFSDMLVQIVVNDLYEEPTW